MAADADEIEAGEAPSTKATPRRPPAAWLGPPVKRWALVVGIAGYRDARLDLKFAARDAEMFAEVLKSERCGRFEKIVSLIDPPIDPAARRVGAKGKPSEGRATAAAIQQVLRRDFADAGPDDLVLLYFSCHGGPDPKRTPGVMYFLTHDTDPDDIAGTALRMDEIHLALRDGYVNAKRVLIFLDTCHSGFAGAAGIKSAESPAKATIDYLEQLQPTLSTEGVAWLSSAEGGELSFEDARWGGGHGVFTHYLLEGLAGKADGFGDRPKDGVVSVDELLEYVRDRVRKDPHAKGQNPQFLLRGSLRELPVAYTADRDSKRLHQIGSRLFEAGSLDGEPAHIAAAAELWRMAAHRVKQRDPLIEADLGHALLACGQDEGAEDVLRKLVEHSERTAPVSAWLHLGIARARLGRFEAAARALDAYAERGPFEPYAAFARSFAEVLRTRERAPRRALLIGINLYEHSSLPRVNGCDLDLMKDLLVTRLGFRAEDIEVLADAKAKRAAIRAALRRLAKASDAGGVAWVYFSGLGMGDENAEVKAGRQEGQIIAFDARPIQGGRGLEGGLSLAELHAAMQRVPALNKTLILDTHVSSAFLRLADAVDDYSLWTATRPGEMAYLRNIVHGGKSVQAGVFTAAWVAALEAAEDAEGMSQGDLQRAIGAEVSARGFAQAPQLVGDPGQALLGRSRQFLAIWDFAQRRHYLDLGNTDIARSYRRQARLVSGPIAPWHASFARAFVAQGRFELAEGAFAAAEVDEGTGDWPTILVRARGRLGAGDWPAAIGLFRSLADGEFGSGGEGGLEALIALTERLAAGRPHALVIGVESYASAAVEPATGARDDARSMAEILPDRFGFAAEDVVPLIDSEALRGKIEVQVRTLAARARDHAGLLYFAGNGSTVEDQPTILSFDARVDGTEDISLVELRAWIGPEPTNLVVILDAGWSRPLQTNVSTRFVSAGGSQGSAVVSPSQGTRAYRHVAPSPFRAPLPRDIVRRPATDRPPEPGPVTPEPGTGAQGLTGSASGRPVGPVAVSPQVVGGQRREIPDEELRLGAVTVLNGSIDFTSADTQPPLVGLGVHAGRPGGVLTGQVLHCLRGSDAASLTGHHLRQFLSLAGGFGARVLVDRPEDCVFAPNRLMAEIDARIALAQRAPFGSLDGELRALIEEEALGASFAIHGALLGLAFAEVEPVPPRARVERIRRAIQPLRTTLALLDAKASPADADRADAQDAEWPPLPEAESGQRERVLAARYHLGRALSDCREDWEEAVRQLRLVREARPADPRVAYHLAHAIVGMLKGDHLREAERLLQEYLAHDVPSGDREAAVMLLEELRATGRSTVLSR